MHQISLGLSIERASVSGFASMMPLTARDGSVLTDRAGSALTGRTTLTSATGIALTKATQIELTSKDA